LGNRTLWFLLIFLGVGCLILMLRHDAGTVAGLDSHDFGSLVYKIALLIFLGGAVLAMFRYRVVEALQAALFWVVIGLVLAVGYTYRHDLREIGERVLADLLPGRAASRDGRTVEIARGTRVAEEF
jgi:aspartyl protease family protein